MKSLRSFLEDSSKQFIFRVNIITVIIYCLFLFVILVYSSFEKKSLVEYLENYFSHNITMVTEEQDFVNMSKVVNDNFQISITPRKYADFCGPGNCYSLSFFPLYLKLSILSFIVIIF